MAKDFVEEVAEALATCSICQEEFNEQDRAPVSLPECRHVFCLACLTTLAKEGDFPCPNCRHQVSLGAQGVRRLQKDIVVLNNVRFVQMKRKVLSQGIHCTECPDNATAVYRCQVCKTNMCGECHKGHHRALRSRHHSVLELSDLAKSVETFLLEKEACRHHEDEVAKLYCLSCTDSHCSLCYALRHNGHRVFELATVYKATLAKSQNYQNKLLERQVDLHELKEIQLAEVDTSDSCREEVYDSILQTMQLLQSDLERRQKELMANCEAAFDGDRTRMMEVAHELTSHADKAGKAKDYISNAERMTRPTEFLEVMRAEGHRLHHILSGPEMHPLPRTHVGFYCSGLQPLRHGISQLGEVKDAPPVAGDLSVVLKMLASLDFIGQCHVFKDGVVVVNTVEDSVRKIILQNHVDKATDREIILQCPDIHLSREAAHRTCDVTSDITMETAACLKTSPADQHFRNYPGTVSKVHLTSANNVFFAVDLSLTVLKGNGALVAEVCFAPPDMKDLRECVVARGGTGILCCRGTDGKVSIVSRSKFKDVHTSVVSDLVREGHTLEVKIGFLLKEHSMIVYDLDRKMKLCVLEGLTLPSQLYCSLWNPDWQRSRISVRSGEHLDLNVGVLQMLASDLLG